METVATGHLKQREFSADAVLHERVGPTEGVMVMLLFVFLHYAYLFILLSFPFFQCVYCFSIFLSITLNKTQFLSHVLKLK